MQAQNLSHNSQAKLNSHGLSSTGASFVGIKKLRQLWSATQDSGNPLNQIKTGKNPFVRFICPHFWTDLNGCRQRLLFTWQLTQQKCSLCSQGTMVSTRESWLWTSLDTPLLGLNRYVLPDKAWFLGSCRSLEQDMNPSGTWSKCVLPTVF